MMISHACCHGEPVGHVKLGLLHKVPHLLNGPAGGPLSGGQRHQQPLAHRGAEGVEVVISYVGPVIGAHTGAGVLALFYLGTNRNATGAPAEPQEEEAAPEG